MPARGGERPPLARQHPLSAAFSRMDRRLQKAVEKEALIMKLSMATGLALALAILTARSHDAAAQPVAATVDTTTATEPNTAMIGSGIGIFALSYVPAVVVGATSGLHTDRTLYVPLAGPWIDLAQRPGCAPAVSCNAENTAKVLVIADGVFQAIGAVTVVGGFLFPIRERVVSTADRRPTLRLGPAKVGGGYGMLALGTF
jgi:hypothetical protein